MYHQISSELNKAGSLRILVVKPRPSYQNIRVDRLMRSEPLELEYLYTILQGYDVALLDGVTSRKSPVKLAHKLQPDVVLFTGYITDINAIFHAARQLKMFTKPPLIFVGGVQAEVTPEFFNDPAIDGVFYHNQLSGIASVLNNIQQKVDYTNTSGALFRIDNILVKNPPEDKTAELPVPKRIFFEQNPSRFRYMHYQKCAVVKTAYGCPGKCSFCYCRLMNGGKYTARNIDEVIDEIADITKSETIFIIDDNFLINRARLLEFCEKWQAKSIKKQFIIYGTANFIANNPDIMAKLRDIGLRNVIVGFEFINDSSLNDVAKAASAKDNDATVEICNRLNIDLTALFIADPRWKVADFKQLTAYLKKKQIIFATFSVMTKFPDNSVPLPADTRWWRYNLLHLQEEPENMTRWQFYRWIFYLYLIPGMNIATLRRLIHQCGFLQAVRILFISTITGIEFLCKLFIWR
ncbi:MAG: radical SAM protein [bacterium]